MTDGFRLWSPAPELELAAVLPLIMVGVPTAGTAGGIGPLPFAAEIESGLLWSAGTEPPAATSRFVVPGVDVGENAFLVALA